MTPVFLKDPTRFYFFTGKGGVGKTSLSCASAIALSDQGRKVLLVSTDPASNLGQVLGVELGPRPTAIPGVSGLWALNIDPRQSAAEYRERVVSPYRGVLPDAAVHEMEEQLSGACTVEIAAFDEFSRLMTDESVISPYDQIVFDTAPTGHTLRLLNLSAAWKGYLETGDGNASCLGPMSGLKGQQSQFEETLKALTDASLTRLILVTRPDKHSLAEAHRTSKELINLGVNNQWLAVNGILGADASGDEIASTMVRQETKALGNIHADLRKLPRTDIPLLPVSAMGIQSLRGLLKPSEPSPAAHTVQADMGALSGMMTVTDLVDGFKSKTGIIMTMGKGGVGKTSLASLLAKELAGRGARVHLTTSDPAAHLEMSLADKYKDLKVSRIDPLAETEAYRKEVMATSGAGLDEDARKLLEEDLRSPCTEEVAVFRAFAKIVAAGQDSIVVIDTAPTGHTLLLLDATEAYHREVARNNSTSPEEVKQLLPRLRDQQYTKILIVTLPEATPVQEASDLDRDLKRAGITPYAWVVNQSLLPLKVNSPVLASRRSQEAAHILKVRDITERAVVMPWQNMG